MKNLAKSLLLAVAMLGAVQSYAQDGGVKRTAKKVEHRTTVIVKEGAHKTSEIASKGASVVVDRRYKGKYGPSGETVYIDKHSRYYYVNHRGHHVYVTKMQLRNRKSM